MLVLSVLPAANAQIRPGNASGVSMGHMHFFVDDVAASRDFWVALGGTAVPFAAGEIVRMPGMLVLISERSATVADSVIDHVAFRAASLRDIAARGFDLEATEGFPGIASIYAPDGTRIELFEEGTATNVGFDAEPGTETFVAGRHNRPLAGSLDAHHLHFYLPEGQVDAARDWYVRHFGAVPGVRWRYQAADLPGINLNFSASDQSRSPTAGTRFDHIGFEIDDLEAFCAGLSEQGIEFDQPYQQVDANLASAVLTDPWGTTIELTEGLDGF